MEAKLMLTNKEEKTEAHSLAKHMKTNSKAPYRTIKHFNLETNIGNHEPLHITLVAKCK
jgi:isoprenylcysteine carboxyl methyltransferase (ICMT) family protein YpbQ